MSDLPFSDLLQPNFFLLNLNRLIEEILEKELKDIYFSQFSSNSNNHLNIKLAAMELKLLSLSNKASPIKSPTMIGILKSKLDVE